MVASIIFVVGMVAMLGLSVWAWIKRGTTYGDQESIEEDLRYR